MLKKLLIILSVLLVLGIGALVAIPIFYKPELVRILKKEANRSLVGTLDFNDDIGLDLFSHFPDLTLRIDRLSLANAGEFEGDTLISASRFEATLNVMSVIKGEQIEVKRIIAKNPRIHAIVLKNGKANWDIAKQDTLPVKAEDTAASKFSLALKSLELENAWINYEDESMDFSMLLDGMNHQLSGDFTQDLFDLKTKTEVKALTLSYGGIPYLSKIKTKLDAELGMDMKHWKFTFKKNICQLNKLDLSLQGWLSMEKDMDMDLSFKAARNSFEQFISILPAMYTSSFAEAKFGGNFGLEGFVKGIYNDQRIPSFQIKAQADQGHFAYPGLPESIRDVAFQLMINNPDGQLDHTLIKLDGMKANLGSDHVNAKLEVKNPISNPWIDLVLKAGIHLENLSKWAPLDKGTSLSGSVDADVAVKGQVDGMDTKNMEKIDAKGNIALKNIQYRSPDLPAGGVDIQSLKLLVTPQSLDMPEGQMIIAGSDLNMKGKIRHYLGYVFSNHTLEGDLTFNSQSLNVNPWMGGETEPVADKKAEDTAAIEPPAIPSNINFTLTGSAGKMLYDNLLMENVKTQVTIKEGKLYIQQLEAGLFDGKVSAKGTYQTLIYKKPDVDFTVNIRDMDMQKASKYFVTMKKFAPMTQYIEGKFSTGMTFKGPLTQQMMPEVKGLSANGDFQMPKMKLGGYQPLLELMNVMGWKGSKEILLEKVKAFFRIVDGKIFMDKDIQVPFKEGILHIYKNGYTALDQTLHYPMMIEIPRKELGKADAEINRLLEEAAKKGIRVSLDEKIPVNVLMSGTIQKPIVKAGLAEAKKRFVEELKKQIAGQFKELADQKRKELEDKAKAEADRLREQAANEAARVKAEAERKAKEEADKLKQKAADEAEKAKQRAKEEAKKKLQGVFKKP